MKRPSSVAAGFVALLVLLAVSPAVALEEPERLWLVGEHAFADRLYPVARRALERLVADHPTDARVPEAVLLLGRARLALGDLESALEAFRRAQTFPVAPGRPLEARFWEAETLFRLKRFAEARAAYDDIVRTDAASPLAPDALYGFAWSELALGARESAVAAFRDFLAAWPEHGLAASAALAQARALIELDRHAEAFALVKDFAAKYPRSPLAADAQYLVGWLKVMTGDVRGGLGDLRAFLAAHPDHAEAAAARRLVAQTVAKYGDREELQDAYKALMEQQPATAEALYDAATIAGRLGRPRDQEAAWKRLRGEFPEHRLTRRLALELAGAAFRRKDWKDAVALAQVAAESDESALRAEALLLAGESELKLRRFPAAARAFEAVGAVGEVEAGVRYRALAGLGLAREEQRDWRAALAAYEAVAARSPDATLRDWARQRAAVVKAQLGTRSAPAPKTPPKKAGAS